MRISWLIIVAVCFMTMVALSVVAQSDEHRQASGLPYKIEPSGKGSLMIVSGKVVLEGSDQFARTPVITVSVLVGGVPLARANTQASGYYYIRGVPRESLALIVEVDGHEVSRQNLMPSGMGDLRIDVTVPLTMVRAAVKPGVISAKDFYRRQNSTSENFSKALEAIRGNRDVEALKLFDKVLESDPNDYEAWTELGNIYFRKKSFENAEAAYFKAIQLKRDYFLALINLGKLYFGAKRFDDSIIVLTNAVKANSDSADAHHFLGESYLAVKKGSLAVIELNTAIRLAPDEKADLHLRLATLYDAGNLKKRAADEYKVFLMKRPDHPEKARLNRYISENN